MKGLRNRTPYPGQRGFVLLLVMVSLAVAVVVIGDLSRRAQQERGSSAQLEQFAKARLAASDAFETVSWWLATRRATSHGFGDTQGHIAADGRPYRMPGGALVQVQDMRGLMSLNIPNRTAMQRLLVAQGLTAQVADAWIDVLMDYTDPDTLRRLNGAEGPEYRALGLEPPRDDWMRSPSELRSLPGWRDMPSITESVLMHASARRSSWVNPNTATPQVLRAFIPEAEHPLLERFLELRRTMPFAGNSQARRATGIDFSLDEFLFYVGNEIQVTVWAPGLPRALQYTLVKLPAGVEGPLFVTEHHRVAPPAPPSDLNDVAAFPLDLAPAPAALAVVAPRP